MEPRMLDVPHCLTPGAIFNNAAFAAAGNGKTLPLYFPTALQTLLAVGEKCDERKADLEKVTKKSEIFDTRSRKTGRPLAVKYRREGEPLAVMFCSKAQVVEY